MAYLEITQAQVNTHRVKQIALTTFSNALFYTLFLLANATMWYLFVRAVAEIKMMQYLLLSVAFLLLFVYLFTRKKSDDPYD